MTESTTDLSEMKAPALRDLAKGLGINSFGKSNDQLREEILTEQASRDASKPADSVEPSKVSGAEEEDVQGETCANGVFLPAGVEPGKDPAWPLYEADDGDWLPLDLTDEQRESLAESFADADVESVVLVTPGDDEPDRQIVRDEDGDYIAVDVDESEPDTAERRGLDTRADGVPTTLSEDGAERAISRQSESAWWCPFDDTSMLHNIDRCPTCGAARDGDVAVRR